MEAGKSITEKELEEVFLSDPAFGIEFLHEECRDQIARYIKSMAPGLTAEELKDVYQDTIVDLVQLSRSSSFDGHRPWRLVYTVAKRRAFDALREKHRRPITHSDDYLKHVTNDLSGAPLGEHWNALDRVAKAEFRQALLEAIHELPPKMRMVMLAFVDRIEELREKEKFSVIAQDVSRETGKQENVVTIKKTFHEAKTKLVQILTAKGFNFLKPE